MGTTPLQYLWNWGDGTFDSVPYPSHTYVTAGLYSICLNITDAAACTNSYCNTFYLQRTTNSMVHVNVVAPSISGITENIALQNDMNIYPNPLMDGSCWLLVAENYIGSTAEIFDTNGKLVFKSEISNHQSEIAFSASQGVYLLRISSSKSSVVRKLVRL
jgi:PKD repeat protein